ncbi:hypothetical protein PRIPAC_88521, partial [Pristionchus pacificus]
LGPRKGISFYDEDFGDAKEKKDVFLKLVQRNHRILEVPVTISSGKIIMDVIEIVESKEDKQTVEFRFESDIFDEFLELIGFSCSETIIEQCGDSEFTLGETRVDDDDEEEYEKVLWITLYHEEKSELLVQKTVRGCTITIERCQETI